MGTPSKRYWRGSNELVNTFFQQAIEGTPRYKGEVERVASWIQDILTEGQPDGPSDAHLQMLFLYQDCLTGEIRTVISQSQGAWLYRTQARERQWEKNVEPIVNFDNRTVGTWKFYEPGYGDPCYRVWYQVDPAWFRDYLVRQPPINVEHFDRALDLAKRYMEREEQ